jgi:hypothetical protein
MTSKVVISAHCADNKQVLIVQSGNWNGENREETTTIENGEVKDLVFYDDMMISVIEVVK